MVQGGLEEEGGTFWLVSCFFFKLPLVVEASEECQTFARY